MFLAVVAGEKLQLSSDRVWLFIALMVLLVVGMALTGRKGRRK